MDYFIELVKFWGGVAGLITFSDWCYSKWDNRSQFKILEILASYSQIEGDQDPLGWQFPINVKVKVEYKGKRKLSIKCIKVYLFNNDGTLIKSQLPYAENLDYSFGRDQQIILEDNTTEIINMDYTICEQLDSIGECDELGIRAKLIIETTHKNYEDDFYVFFDEYLHDGVHYDKKGKLKKPKK